MGYAKVIVSTAKGLLFATHLASKPRRTRGNNCYAAGVEDIKNDNIVCLQRLGEHFDI